MTTQAPVEVSAQSALLQAVESYEPTTWLKAVGALDISPLEVKRQDAILDFCRLQSQNYTLLQWFKDGLVVRLSELMPSHWTSVIHDKAWEEALGRSIQGSSGRMDLDWSSLLDVLLAREKRLKNSLFSRIRSSEGGRVKGIGDILVAEWSEDAIHTSIQFNGALKLTEMRLSMEQKSNSELGKLLHQSAEEVLKCESNPWSKMTVLEIFAVMARGQLLTVQSSLAAVWDATEVLPAQAAGGSDLKDEKDRLREVIDLLGTSVHLHYEYLQVILPA